MSFHFLNVGCSNVFFVFCYCCQICRIMCFAMFLENPLVKFLLPCNPCLFKVFPPLCVWGFIHRGAVPVPHVLLVGRWGHFLATFAASLLFLRLSPHFFSFPLQVCRGSTSRRWTWRHQNCRISRARHKLIYYGWIWQYLHVGWCVLSVLHLGQAYWRLGLMERKWLSVPGWKYRRFWQRSWSLRCRHCWIWKLQTLCQNLLVLQFTLVV